MWKRSFIQGYWEMDMADIWCLFPRKGPCGPEVCVPAQLRDKAAGAGKFTPARNTVSSEASASLPSPPRVLWGLKWPRIWMAGEGGAEHGGESVNIVTLVVPSIPQRRSLASSMGIQWQLEGPPTWTER